MLVEPKDFLITEKNISKLNRADALMLYFCLLNHPAVKWTKGIGAIVITLGLFWYINSRYAISIQIREKVKVNKNSNLKEEG